MRKLGLAVLVLSLLLTGCGKANGTNEETVRGEEAAATVEETEEIIELKNNSELSIELLKKIPLTAEERKEYAPDVPYHDEASNEDIEALGFPYPENESDICITQIFLHSDKNQVLGLTVGDDIEKINEVVEKYGYITNISSEEYLEYYKGNVHIIMDLDTDHRITQLTVAVTRPYEDMQTK